VRLGALLFPLGAVLVQMHKDDYQRILASLRAAIIKSGLMEKEVAYACGVTDPAQFSKMLSGQQRIPLDVIAAMPEPVQQHLFLDGVIDKGLPRDLVGSLRMAKAILRGGKHGRSVA
jgi:hypothetical protein